MNAIIIRHYSCPSEVDAIKALCEWQLINITKIEDKSGQALKDTKGHGDPVIYHSQTDEILAIGFFGFIRYLEENGLKLC